MRKWLTLLWLLCGVGIVVYHFNGGRKQVRREEAYRQYCEIQQLEQTEHPDWKDIAQRYDKLAATLSGDEDRKVLRQVHLAKCRAMLEALQIRAAVDQLQILLDETANAYGEDAKLTRAVRSTMGRAQFMAGWVLQQTGAPDNEYRQRYERSRQIFRYLVEHDNEASFSKYQSRIARQLLEIENEN
jgi:cbb3-type cytochrome oxidase subunit 3